MNSLIITKRFGAFCVISLGLVLTGCATAPSDPESLAEFKQINDPAEPTNRAILDANMALDKNLFKPAAKAYRAAVPRAARNGLHNAFSNLSEPMTAFNDILQANPGRAWVSTQRFVINSTVGVAGLFDVASDWDLPRHQSDFGQTFGVWGIEPGPYVQLPLLGPSNPRDAIGFALTAIANPFSRLVGTPTAYDIASTATETLDTRERNLEALDDLERNSLDFYAALRSAYRQQRQFKVDEGKRGDSRDTRVEINTPVIVPGSEGKK